MRRLRRGLVLFWTRGARHVGLTGVGFTSFPWSFSVLLGPRARDSDVMERAHLLSFGSFLALGATRPGLVSSGLIVLVEFLPGSGRFTMQKLLRRRLALFTSLFLRFEVSLLCLRLRLKVRGEL